MNAHAFNATSGDARRVPKQLCLSCGEWWALPDSDVCARCEDEALAPDDGVALDDTPYARFSEWSTSIRQAADTSE